MPTNDQDARALTYLARRLRAETHGAAVWDEAGTYAAVVKFVGQNLAETVERVTRHAADREARTPGAIARPFVPEMQQASQRDTTPAHLRCSTCSKPQSVCEAVRYADDDHEFQPASSDRKRSPEAMAAIVEDARQRLEKTNDPSPPIERTPDPRIDAIRAELANPTQETTVTDQTNSIEAADGGKEDVA